MKFNKHLKPEHAELLEAQYREYIKRTPMTQKEQRVLREWVKNGHSVYENASGVWNDGQTPVEFLTVYRDEEYIREHTKGMNAEETKKFAMAFYGWDDEIPEPATHEQLSSFTPFEHVCDEELPFN